VAFEFVSPELKTCPRCGGAARYGKIEHGAVICSDCGKVGNDATQWNDPKWRLQFRYERAMIELAAVGSMLSERELL
jgi:transcription initiation factor TFIIIB Brf1 subunit/transcription initiation factor TFIIB